MNKIYHIDISKYSSKLISEIPSCDIYVSMGCNVKCPFTDRNFDFNFEIEDPTGKDEKEFRLVYSTIVKLIKE